MSEIVVHNKIVTARSAVPRAQQFLSIEELIGWHAHETLVNHTPQECKHMETNTLWGTATYNSAPCQHKQLLKQCNGDTEVDILLRISQKYNMCSRPCRLTEFCNLQCISHFAAPFIVVRTETFVAEDDRLSSTITFDKIKQTIEFRQMQV